MQVMPLTLDDFNGMELLWGQITNKPDENHAVLTQADVEGMWEAGIVDTKQFSKDAWFAAFDAHKQPDGTYFLSKEEFLAKESYRYKGEIMMPFDPALINEGKYTDEGLNELFTLSIAPSCSFSPAELKNFLDDMKGEFREADGLVKIRGSAKAKIKDLLYNNPSPLRRLELIFDYLIREGLKAIGEDEGIKITAERLSQAQIAKIQASSFSAAPTSDAEVKWKTLSAIQKTVKKAATPVESKSGTTLKKIKRSRRGLRG